MDYRESQRYAKEICEHCESKGNCGMTLHKFTAGMSESEAASFVHDLITLDFFADLRGSLKDFLLEMHRCRAEVEALLSESHERDKNGELRDSDEDSEGNLM